MVVVVCVLSLLAMNIAQFVIYTIERAKMAELLAARTYSEYAAGRGKLNGTKKSPAVDAYAEYANAPMVPRVP